MTEKTENNEQKDAVEIALKTVHGDLTKKMLEEIQQMGQAWDKTPQAQQNAIIERIKQNAEHQIRTIMSLVANRGFEHCSAIVESATSKDEWKIVLKTHNFDGGVAMAKRSGGGKVVVVFTDEDEYIGNGDMPEGEPDQGSFLDDNNVGEISDDDLYDKGLEVISEKNQVATTHIQRELNVGYNQAARILEMLVEDSVISPANESGFHEVFKVGDGDAPTPVDETSEEKVEETEPLAQLERAGSYDLIVNGAVEATVEAYNLEDAVHALGFTEIEVIQAGTFDESATIIDDERVQDDGAKITVSFSKSQPVTNSED